MEPEEEGRLKRRVPRTLAQAAERLAQETSVESEGCAAHLREILNRGGMLVREDGGRVFAFKLHQFIGQGRALFATLEAADRREFSLEGQVQAGGGRLFVTIKFCRQCGQDYYHVLRSDTCFLPHPVGTESEDDASHPGYSCSHRLITTGARSVFQRNGAIRVDACGRRGASACCRRCG